MPRIIEFHLMILLTAAALQAQTTYNETVLHNFAQILAPYGARPIAPLVRDRAGNLYVTTYAGGPWAQGTVFKIDPSGRQTVLHSFTGGPDGGLPYAGLVLDEAGSLFGTTAAGGNACSSNSNGHCGVVFRLDPAGHETVLYSFSGPDGETPFGGVVRDAAGNLYGTTGFGGKNGVGVVFKLDPAGQETILHNFTNGADGGFPNSGVILDSGDLYGTTNCGGTGTGCSGAGGAGVVYRIDAAGHLTVLYNFSGGADGSQPYAGVVRDAAGNLYGTTEFGGAAGNGVVFQLDPAGHETVLHAFMGGADGRDPIGSLLLDPSGNLYGTTAMGGTSCACGVVFKLDVSHLYSVLHRFTGPDGALPEAGLIADPAGNLYGTPSQGGFGEGLIFKIDAAGIESALFSYPARIDGMNPLAGLVRDGAGNLYGTASAISVLNTGSVFKLDPLGRETILHIFTIGDGAEPASRVTLDGAGHLFGTTYYGGANGKGIVYRLDNAGSETVLHTFTGGDDGANPTAGVIRQPLRNRQLRWIGK